MAVCDSEYIDFMASVPHQATGHGLAKGLKPFVYLEIAGNLPSRRCVSEIA
jgi:hypothetical protein